MQLNLPEFMDSYVPVNAEEAAEWAAWKQFLAVCGENIYTRENLVGHVVASAFVVNRERTKVLMAYHNILQRWAWLGGHADGDSDLAAVAEREVKEESSLKNVRFLNPLPVDICVNPVGLHQKRGKIVPAHSHYSVCYAFEADENELVCVNSDENSGIKWIAFEDISVECKNETDSAMYLRIVEKIKRIK